MSGDENIDLSNSADLGLHTTVMQSESYFALMGDYGNNVCVYDTESVILRNRIPAQHIVALF